MEAHATTSRHTYITHAHTHTLHLCRAYVVAARDLRTALQVPGAPGSYPGWAVEWGVRDFGGRCVGAVGVQWVRSRCDVGVGLWRK